MADLFLSYHRADVQRAQSIAAALEGAGHSVWWDRNIKGGAQYSKEIERALALADAVVVLWSRHSVESAWVRDEAVAGRDSGRLVPATIDGTLPPLGFRQYQTVDLSNASRRGGIKSVDPLIDAIVALPGGDGQVTSAHSTAPATQSGLTRRVVAGGLVAAVVGGAAYLLLGKSEQSAPPEVQALLDQAWQSWTQSSSEGNNQAIGLYRRATQTAPEFADAWGLLACVYADTAHWWATASERPALRQRAREAAQRALQLDPKNAYGRAALAYAQPFRGNWLLMEREYRQVLRDQPGKWLIIYSLGLLMSHVGRMAEAAEFFDQLEGHAPTANQFYYHTLALWSAGQLGEAERLLGEASSIFSTHPRIWGLRFDMALAGGRPAAALGMADDRQGSPTSVTGAWLQRRGEVARALATDDSDQVSAVAAALMRDARESGGQAVRALIDLSLLNRLDEAFAVANAYFFSRGFSIPDAPVAVAARPEITMESRGAISLFNPTTAAMRADRRFEQLMDELGLAAYWRAVGALPDFRKS